MLGKRSSEDGMARQHHPCNGHELGQTSGYGERQRGMACSSPRGHKELDMTGLLNSNMIIFMHGYLRIP